MLKQAFPDAEIYTYMYEIHIRPHPRTIFDFKFDSIALDDPIYVAHVSPEMLSLIKKATDEEISEALAGWRGGSPDWKMWCGSDFIIFSISDYSDPYYILTTNKQVVDMIEKIEEQSDQIAVKISSFLSDLQFSVLSERSRIELNKKGIEKIREKLQSLNLPETSRGEF